MKTNRSSIIRAATVLAVGLLLVAGSPVGCGKATDKLGEDHKGKSTEGAKTETGAPLAKALAQQAKLGEDHKGKSTEGAETESDAPLAKALAKQAKQVHERFTTSRKALRPPPSPQGRLIGYSSSEVTGLIADAHKDLDQAIQNAKASGTEPLRAWVDDQFQQIQGKIPPPGSTASLPDPSARQTGAQPAEPQTIPFAMADQLLDEVEKVVNKIFSLADRNDLEVDLWVGSPQVRKAKPISGQALHATLSFCPQGKINDSSPAHNSNKSIQMMGKKVHVLRGLYSYEADLGLEKGAVIQRIKYPDSAASVQNEPLDLVNRGSFFCCWFDGSGYCKHVTDENECR